MGKKSGSRSGIRIRDEDLDHISESLETIFWVKILKFKFFDADPGSGFKKIQIWDPRQKTFGSWIREGKNSDPGSGINISDCQHCPQHWLR
jgi:hypothetical protein